MSGPSTSPDTAATIRWHAEVVDKLYDEVGPPGPGAVAMVVREPSGGRRRGHPLELPGPDGGLEARTGPGHRATASSSSRPAQTALSLLRIAELGGEAGIPAGVLNVVPGSGEVVGVAIARHPDIDVVAFTPARPRSGGPSSTTAPIRTSSAWSSSSVARAPKS